MKWVNFEHSLSSIPNCENKGIEWERKLKFVIEYYNKWCVDKSKYNIYTDNLVLVDK